MHAFVLVAIAFFLLHRLNHGFDELLLGFGETVLGVELLVYVGNRLRPVDVGRRGEVLEGDEWAVHGGDYSRESVIVRRGWKGRPGRIVRRGRRRYGRRRVAIHHGGLGAISMAKSLFNSSFNEVSNDCRQKICNGKKTCG